DRVSTLLPGIVEMAWDCSLALRSRNDARPVWIVPLAWRFAFLRDVRRRLAAEIGHIQRALELPRTPGTLDGRFAQLMWALLRRQCARLDLPGPAGGDYFAAQVETITVLRERLSACHGPLDPDFTRANFQLRKAIRERTVTDPDGARADRARL